MNTYPRGAGRVDRAHGRVGDAFQLFFEIGIGGDALVLPALGPVIGIDITGDLVREAGEQIVQTVQAVGGLIGFAMTIYGRVRASQPLAQREVTMKL
jgi:hypothetical protein